MGLDEAGNVAATPVTINIDHEVWYPEDQGQGDDVSEPRFSEDYQEYEP